jgi:hypothetical protein
VCGSVLHDSSTCPWFPHEYGNWSPIGINVVPINAGPDHPPADNDEGGASEV